MYHHIDWQGKKLSLPKNKVVCVGSNYAEHIAEMDGVKTIEPVIFIKPETALCHLQQPIVIPKKYGAVHHEVELAILLGQELKLADEQQAQEAILGVGVAIDLTLRDLQTACKKSGQPWEKAKSFDGACPVSGFLPNHYFANLQAVRLTLTVNNELRQDGNTKDMITSVLSLISYISHFFTLRAGDIVLTGTPAGVGNLQAGDTVTVGINEYSITTKII